MIWQCSRRRQMMCLSYNKQEDWVDVDQRVEATESMNEKPRDKQQDDLRSVQGTSLSYLSSSGDVAVFRPLFQNRDRFLKRESNSCLIA